MKALVRFSRGLLFCSATVIPRGATKRSDRRDCFALLAVTFYVFSLTSCATMTGSINPRVNADTIAAHNGFQKLELVTRNFPLTSYIKINEPGKPLILYIEGDGYAWITRNRLSKDPTPVNPLMLMLASMDSSPNVAYLARPGQYWDHTKGAICSSEYWSNKRFSEEVIASMNEAVDQLKIQAQAAKIHLVGYSGGGAIAVLVAARRADIVSIRTLAGNLDHRAVTRFQSVSALSGSLNPIDFVQEIRNIPQEHLYGGKDKVVPASIAMDFVKKTSNPSCVKATEIPAASHSSGWVEAWPEILHRTPACKDEPNHSIPNLKSR